MPIVAERYCSRCRRNVLAERRSPNHVLHAILTLLFCGLWLPIWILAALNQPYHCPRCGRVAKTLLDKILLGILVAFLILLLPIAVVSVMSMK